MQANAAVPRQLNPQKGAIVWHGSPHKFDAFDSSKIGTGEGAQAYGHGLYLAESPDVAKGYRDALSKVSRSGQSTATYTVDGVPVKLPEYTNAKAVHYAASRGELDKFVKLWADMPDSDIKRRSMAEVEELRGKTVREHINEGALYKVDLPDEQIAKMLDWDKPLSQQAPEVQRALRELAESGDEESIARWLLSKGNDPHAGALFKASGAAMPGVDLTASYPGSAQMSAALRGRGIPGIRYLDGGSRGAGTGTSNYVVFPGEENALRILERNGAPLK
jgi:hypothetical protein